MAIDVYQELKTITAALSAKNIEHAVCGGWAMAIHGAPRATVDIDLLILSEDLERVYAAVKELGYWLEGAPMSFHNGDIEIRRISKIDHESGFVLSLDFLLITPILADIWQARTVQPLIDSTMPVVSREGLIKLKTISGRKQDLADIEKLEELSDES